MKFDVAYNYIMSLVLKNILLALASAVKSKALHDALRQIYDQDECCHGKSSFQIDQLNERGHSMYSSIDERSGKREQGRQRDARMISKSLNKQTNHDSRAEGEPGQESA